MSYLPLINGIKMAVRLPRFFVECLLCISFGIFVTTLNIRDTKDANNLQGVGDSTVHIMEQLLLHLIGDYVTQSDWMANNKTKSHLPCLIHATFYSLPFLLLTYSPLALLTIWSTHFFIDRYRVARYVVWTKNLIIAPRDRKRIVFVGEVSHEWFMNERYLWENCKTTGYPSETPAWLAFWLMIIADNTMHLTINYLSLRFL